MMAGKGGRQKGEDMETPHRCIAAAMQIFGDRWSPRLIHALRDGCLRFCQLQQAAGGVNPRTLSQRLAGLEQAGIVAKTVFDCKPPHTEYRLTAKGADLLPILDQMAAWSERYPAPDSSREDSDHGGGQAD